MHISKQFERQDDYLQIQMLKSTLPPSGTQATTLGAKLSKCYTSFLRNELDNNT